MFTFRRLLLCVAFGVVGLGAGCGNDVSVAADPTPAPTETPTAPASTNNVSAEDVDTTVVDGVAADPASTVVPVRSRGQQSTSERGQTYASIRDVDFLDGFSYDTGFEFGSSMATVTDGSYENGEFGDDDYFWFGVTDVDFGDLNGDGLEDAIVATSWNGGGSGYFDSVSAFQLVEGTVEPAGTVLFGDRADGGIHDMRIENGLTYVWSFSTTLGACCPNEIARHTLVLGEHWLVRADVSRTRTWMSLDSYDSEFGNELKFLPGTSSALVSVYGWENDGVFTFEANQSQRLTLALTGGPAPADISVTVLATGEILSGLAEMVLPVDGFYEVTVTFDGEREETTMVDVIIDDGAPIPAVSWTPAVEQLLLTKEPLVTTSLVWPVFLSDQPGTEAANDALASFVLGFDDAWVEDVTEFSTPLDESNYDVQYDVTFATDQIVSVRFDYYDYVCCRPYPNYGPISAVLDLQAGRLVPVNEIVDMDRIDEVNRLWVTELENQGLLPEAAALLAEQPHFDSLTLVPEGVEFGTGRNSLGGGFGGTLAVVTYEELGNLMNADLLARLPDR